ncbi:LPXTG cell wall anchor domain-containing protein [Staphylococcus epidermidis]|uniref:LPXTG cell wall anchor domain-containing protein n=1 Tax=Staphylococcus epidermidis TaxID=1282 RepID=UPI0019348333|nr:LPXTG cell wall anchor domain-containing protein [Staphylococcus epidermidis]MBM0802783.1 LPXTG cell wall anchor domain-containing protein [Staphylococcus epidermidis]
MKTTKILGATTLAGALLFTGLGNADAAEQININNAKDIAYKATFNDEASKGGFSPAAKSDIGSNDSYTTTKKGNDYIISSPDEGAYTYRLAEDGKLYMTSTYDGKEYYISQANVDNSQQPTQEKQNQTDNNSNQTQTTTDETQNPATDNAKAENNTQALPETGEESSNTTLVTMIASVILAAGSLLAFKRFSKEK